MRVPIRVPVRVLYGEFSKLGPRLRRTEEAGEA